MRLLENVIGLLPKNNNIRQGYELRNLLKSSGMNVSDAKAVTVKLMEQSKSLTKSDIKDWRDAWETAINIEKPRRADLYPIYADAMVDLHLQGAIRNRVLRTLSRGIKVMSNDGKNNEEATKSLHKKWFRKFCKITIESKFWGTTLIQFGDIVEGKFSYVKVVPRNHVVPEKGIILREEGDEDGVDYRKGSLSEWVIEVGDQDDLGLLLALSKEAISKRNVIQFWDEFAEIFGIPIRIAKTSSRDKKDLTKINNMMQNMGSALSAVFPQGTDIEIKEASKGDAFNVFDKRIERANSEMSKGVNGQTMTMDDGSSKSQAQVHLQVSDDIVESDGIDLLYAINDDLIPLLIKRGFKDFKEGDVVVFDDTQELSIQEQQKIDEWLIQEFEIELDYFKEKYNTQIIDFKKKEVVNLNTPKPDKGGVPGK